MLSKQKKTKKIKEVLVSPPLQEDQFLRIKKEDVFAVTKGIRGEAVLLLDGQPMSEKEIHNLQEEIKFIEKTKLWQIYTQTLKQKAIEKSVYKSTSFDDMRNGKEMLEIIKLLTDINAYIRAWKPIPPLRPIPNKPIIH